MKWVCKGYYSADPYKTQVCNVNFKENTKNIETTTNFFILCIFRNINIRNMCFIWIRTVKALRNSFH